MIIVVVHWKIRPERVGEFLEFWKSAAVVNDRKGLIAEFLSEGHSTDDFDWITWPFTGCEGLYRSFVNVGYWKSGEEFEEQVAEYFDSSAGPESFEAEPRQRTALKPKCWRIGNSRLPAQDSAGVL